MWWIKVDNEKELKRIAKQKYTTRPLENLKRDINLDIEEFLDKIDLNVGPKNTKKLVASSWKDLNERISKIRKFYLKLEEEKPIVKTEAVEKKNNEIEYFKSRSDELIFYILEFSGKKRNEKLGVKESYYRNKRQAKIWRNTILKEIHPDICKNVKANEAIHAFEQLCELIIR